MNRQFLRLAEALAYLVILSAGLVLAGWILNIKVLTNFLPQSVPMNPMTAVAFLTAATACLFQLPKAGNVFRWIGKLLAFLILAAGVLRLIDYASIPLLPVSFDQLLFSGKLQGNVMAPNTAFGFILAGGSLLCLQSRFMILRLFAQIQTIGLLLLTLVALFGYVYDFESFYKVKLYIPMAFTTSLTFAMLGHSLLFLQPDFGIMKVVASETLGGTTARRLLPWAVCLPIGLGWLRLLGENAGLYPTEVGVALNVMFLVIILTLLILANSFLLNKVELKQKQAEEDLAKQTNILQSILSSMGEGVVVADKNGKFLVWNEAAEKIVGLGPVNAPVAKWSNEFGVFLPDQKTPYPADELPLAKAIRGISVTNDLQIIKNRMKPDGTWVSVTGRPLKDVKNVHQGGVVVFRDVSEQITAEHQMEENQQKLREVNKELEAFSYSVSHDLRAPLRAINGFSKAILDDYSGELNPEAQRYLRLIESNAVDMGRLIDDLLAFSRLGRKEHSLVLFNMKELVQNVVKELQPFWGDRKIVMTIRDLPSANGDPAMIHQVWTNLISNAAKFTKYKEEGLIEIGGSLNGREAVYYVRDNGVGFDMKYADKLFTVFQRLHDKSQFEGTGVGLAIAQRVIQRHGGRTWVDAKPDQGATFYFSLPVTV